MPVQRAIFLYTLKVWLTGVLLSPVVYLISSLVNEEDYYSVAASVLSRVCEQLQICLSISLMEMAMSFLTWLGFLLVVVVTCLCISSSALRRVIFAVGGLALAIVTITMVMPSAFEPADEFFVLAITNCLFITAGAWFYRVNVEGKISILDIY